MHRNIEDSILGFIIIILSIGTYQYLKKGGFDKEYEKNAISYYNQK